MKDHVDISARDLAFWMMCVSDNTATDVLQEIVTTDRVNKRLRDLGFIESTLCDDCEGLLATFFEDLGTGDLRSPTITPDVIARNRALSPDTTNRTTPREMTRLLSMIWRNEAGPRDAMAEVRRILAAQVWPHRLQAGFEDGIAVAGKTGTLLIVRNEVGVVEYPDGGRYAVAVFLRTRRGEPRQLASDLAIGALARAAVDELRVTT
jgi:beta-lactamase class A